VSHALISQVDFFASLASLTGQKLDANAAPDSYNMLSALLGNSMKGRQEMLEEAFTLAVRSGSWKYIAPQTKGTPDWLKNKKVETGLALKPQLFDLKNDIGEEHNVIEKYPDLAKKMKKMLNNIENQATRPGYRK